MISDSGGILSSRKAPETTAPAGAWCSARRPSCPTANRTAIWAARTTARGSDRPRPPERPSVTRLQDGPDTMARSLEGDAPGWPGNGSENLACSLQAFFIAFRREARRSRHPRRPVYQLDCIHIHPGTDVEACRGLPFPLLVSPSHPPRPWRVFFVPAPEDASPPAPGSALHHCRPTEEREALLFTGRIPDEKISLLTFSHPPRVSHFQPAAYSGPFSSSFPVPITSP